MGVIYEEAEYIASYFESLPVRLAGKSGTGERAGHNPTAWYITFAPENDPKYLVAVTIEEATWANSSAIYANRDIWGAIYGVKNEIPYSITGVESVGD